MPKWLERCLAGYFQLLGLVCGWNGRRLDRFLGTGFLLLVMVDLASQIRSYFKADLPTNEQVSFYFAKSIHGVNVAYKVIHAGIAFTAIVECQKSRRLLEQLPPVRISRFVYRQLVLEVFLNCYALLLSLGISRSSGMYLESLRYAYSNQAVRARYLQMFILVDRLDSQLEELQRRTASDSADYQALRMDYARLARISRSLSQLYGLSLLLLNVLCLGDCLIVCNVYFMVEYLESVPAGLIVVIQAIYIVLPTLVKLSTLCAACQRCLGKSKQLQAQLKDRPGHTASEKGQIEEFALQIIQDPIQFDICGIYHLNLQTLAGMFFFILEALVMFLQFVSLVKPPSID
ncbi:hypothetical protein KR009_001986 [Drosophila setifemur]|nr:hypothetical protein KR009_001986 [Drosophila setifemur]